MLGEPHDVDHEFPQYHEKVEALKARDPEFATLMKEHDQLDAQIRDLETGGQPVIDEYMEELKHKRAVLKDRIYDRLRHS